MASLVLRRITSLDVLPIVPPDAAQDTINLHCHRGTWLAHGQLGVPRDTSDNFLKSCFSAFQTPACLGLGAPGFVHPQDAIPFVELHEVTDSPFLQPVKVPLGASSTTW